MAFGVSPSCAMAGGVSANSSGKRTTILPSISSFWLFRIVDEPGQDRFSLRCLETTLSALKPTIT